jgi:transglutaminase-like putative cysteine protease
VRLRLGALLLGVLLGGGAMAADEVAVYRAGGPDAALFDQYDNDGYSLAVSRGENGALTLTVRVSGSPLESRAPYPTRVREERLTPSAERDAWAASLAAGARTQAEAVERILAGVASEIRYDPDRLRLQDPATVFATRKAHCVGFAELSVDLLRRAGISARTVQGILRTPPASTRRSAASTTAGSRSTIRTAASSSRTRRRPSTASTPATSRSGAARSSAPRT